MTDKPQDESSINATTTEAGTPASDGRRKFLKTAALTAGARCGR